MRQPRGQLGKDSKQRTQRGLSPRGGDVPGVFQESTVAEAQSEQGSKERNQGSEAGGVGGGGLFGSHSERHESHGRIVSTCVR